MTDRPIPAATLVLVRETSAGAPDILIVERASGMAFAGGALVFPGGRIDEADAKLGGELGFTDDGAAIAAVRETLEETAVPAALTPTPSAAQAAELQQALLDGSDFAGLLASHGLSIDRDALTPFARWVPQFHATRRFDTLFLLARAPEGDWQPNPIAGECSGAFWLAAQDVLDRERAGQAKLIFPTRRNLERLAQHRSFAEMLADARAHPVESITPWMEEHDGQKFITIPDNIGYPVVRERLEGLWRG